MSEYLREMGQMGYKVGTLEALIKMRDHGVSPDYVKGMNALGQKLTADQLVNARDHGVTPEFASELAALGYGSMPVEGLVRVRDHGVTPDFVKALSAAGYSKLSIDELVNTRGWDTLNYVAIPMVATCALAIAWLAARRLKERAA